MAIESTAFPTLLDYAKALSDHFYPWSSKSEERIYSMLRYYIRDRFDKEWYDMHLRKENRYLIPASRMLGVEPGSVIQYLHEHDIDLTAFIWAVPDFNLYQQNAYNFFYTRLLRYNPE